MIPAVRSTGATPGGLGSMPTVKLNCDAWAVVCGRYHSMDIALRIGIDVEYAGPIIRGEAPVTTEFIARALLTLPFKFEELFDIYPEAWPERSVLRAAFHPGE